MAKLLSKIFSPTSCATLILLLLLTFFLFDSRGYLSPENSLDWADLALVAALGYLAFELIAFTGGLLVKKFRQFGILWLLLITAAVAIPVKMQMDLLRLREAIAEVEKIEIREMNGGGKWDRKIISLGASERPESPLAFATICRRRHLASLNFSIEQDIGCGCCYCSIRTEIDDDDIALFARLRRLERLCVSSSSITDSACRSLRSMPNLASLDLSNNKITDVGVGCLNGLGGLEELSVAETSVTDVGIESLGYLPELKFLNASGTLVSDATLSTLSKFSQLEQLELHDTNVVGVELSQLSKLQNLRRLGVSVSNPIEPNRRAEILRQIATAESASVELKGLDQLKEISLNLFSIYDSLCFEDLTSLEQLSLTFSQCPHEVSEVSYRRDSYLAECEMCQSKSNRIRLSNLPSLSWAMLYYPGEIHLSNLPSLKRLDLRVVDGDCFKNLHQLDSLEELYIDCNLLRDPTSLLQLGRLANLRKLSISGGQCLTDQSLEMLKSFPHLQVLSISGGEFSSPGLKFLSHNEYLEVLHLPDVNDAGEPLRCLNGLSYLRELRIGSGSIGSLRLEGLKRLEHFYVRPTKISSLVLRGLVKLEHLEFDEEQSIERLTLSDMPGLRSFNLKPSSVRPLKFVSLDGLPNLVTLRLASLKPNPNVNDQAFENLGTFKSLTGLNLENSQVSEELLEKIDKLPKLKRLILTGTPIESHTIELTR